MMERSLRPMNVLAALAVVMIVGGVAVIAVDSGLAGISQGADLGSRTPPAASYTLSGPTASGSIQRPSGPPGQTPGLSTPSPSPSRSPTPRPAGFVVTGGAIVYYTSDGTVVPMPAIAGLRSALIENRAIYYAQSGNRYNLQIGSYAGEFRPDVTMQQPDGSTAQTGGVVVVGQVAGRLIADALAEMPEGSAWVVALPVDIRSSNRRVDVTFDSFGLHGWSDTPRVAVRFVGQLPVVNVIPANAGYHVLVEQIGVTAWQVIDPTRLTLSDSALDKDHLMNELLVYGNGTSSTGRDILVDKRVEVGRVMLTAADEVSVSLVVRDSRADMTPDRVLQVADVPVFVASS
jgi:hypothetical protein